MNSEFGAQLDAWHDFYAATAGASATLLGLLFVALALNPQLLKTGRSPVLRAWAGETFHTFLVVLSVSLVALIPETSPTGIYVTLAILGVQGIYRVARDRLRIATYRQSAWGGRAWLAWPVAITIAYVTCLWVAVDLYLGVYDSFDWLVLTIFVLATYGAASCFDLIAEFGSIRSASAEASPAGDETSR
jgi:hypothetical protein